jgi:protein SCO1/2
VSVTAWSNERKRSRALTLLLIGLLVALAAIPLVALYHAFSPRDTAAPDFTLVDQNGRSFTLSTLRGRPVAMFFGYTHCPDECPTTLAHLARAVRSTGVPTDAAIVFVTVDPERDTPAALKRYLALFDPHFIGLTGSRPTMNPVYAAYHAWSEAVPVHHGRDDYSVSHGTTIYYIGRDGSIKGLGEWDDGTSQIATALKEYQ